jgi:hypothetical protein
MGEKTFVVDGVTVKVQSTNRPSDDVIREAAQVLVDRLDRTQNESRGA